MFEKIYSILVDILGESKQGRYDKNTQQFQFNCPHCAEENGGIPDGKHNLEVLLSEREGLKFHCWKCGSTDGMMGSIGRLIKRYGNPTLYNEYKNAVTELVDAKLYDINLFSGNTDTTETQTQVSLPVTYKKIEIEKCRNNQLLAYLEKRKIDQEMIDRYNIGVTKWDGEDFRYRNRIIIPSYDAFGDLNYFIGRDYTGKSKLKYCNCHADKKLFVFQESQIDWDSPIYLCEGVFDAMRFPINGISMLGKSLSKDSVLFNTIYTKANSTVTIVLDGDTEISETKRIYQALDFGRLRNKIRYINMAEDCAYKDMSELFEHEGKQGIISILRKQKKFSEIDLVF